MHRLYVSDESRFLMMRKGGARFIPKIDKRNMRLAKSNLKHHLENKYSVGLYAAKEGSKFICFDIDSGGKQRLFAAVNALMDAGFDSKMIHISSSGKKGYHVEIYADALIDPIRTKKLHRYVLAATGASSMQIECLPTHNQSIKLPLSIHPDTGKICWFLDQQSLTPIKTQSYLLDIRQHSLEHIHELIDGLSVKDEAKDVIANTSLSNPLDNAPDMFTPMQQAGTRNSRMTNLAIYLRSHGTTEDSIKEILLEWISCQDKRFYKASRKEILCDIKRIVGWVCRRDFIIPGSTASHAFATVRDMQKIFSLSKKQERKLCLLLLVCERGHVLLTQRQIAQALGITDRSVRNLITRLSARGIVYQQHGIVKKTQKGHYCRKASSYHIDLHRISDGKGHNNCKNKFFWINLCKLLADFQKQYYVLMLQSLPKADVFHGLSKSEKIIVKALIEEEDVYGFCSYGNTK